LFFFVKKPRATKATDASVVDDEEFFHV